MRTHGIRTLALVFFSLAATLLPAGAASRTAPPSSGALRGEWALKIDANGMELPAILSFLRSRDGKTAAQWISFWGVGDVRDMKFEKGALSFSVPGASSSRGTFRGKIARGKLSGTLATDRGEFPVSGKRERRVPGAAGTWDISFRIGERDITSKLVITAGEKGKLSVQWPSERVEHEVAGASFRRGKLTFKTDSRMGDRRWQSTFEGKIRGSRLEGKLRSERGEIEIKGRRAGGVAVGTWILDIEAGGGSIKQRLRIEPDLSALFGPVRVDRVAVEGKKVQFTAAIEAGDRRFDFEFEGTVAASRLTGELRSSQGTAKVSGTRARPGGVARYSESWESLKRHKAAPDWFRDAKFGIYFHWGVYCVPAFGSEWYPRNMYIKNRGEYKHHVATYGDPTKFGYHDFVPLFKAEKFDPDAWADLFQKAGARFAGPVAEHHDGFSMWASKVTPWNAKDMGPHRDIAGELERAIRARGMRFITSFHHARNSLHEVERGGKKVWTGHYEFVKKDFPSILEDPTRAILYGYMPRERFLDMWVAKLKEVIDGYHPDIIWFDSWLNEIPAARQMEYLAYYFNSAASRGQQVVVTCKQRDMPHEIAVEDFEKGRTNRLTEFTWLTDDTISRGSWCYTKGLGIKSTREVLHVLIDIVSKNGQLLLNISPRADGTIPDNQREVLLGIGRWLGKYGEAIYETRPFLTFGEGPTRLEKGGHFVRMKGGYKPEDIRFTRKGSTVYAIALGWPGAGKRLVLESFGEKGPAGGVEVQSVSMLGTDARVAWKKTPEGLAVTVPGEGADELARELAVVFKIRTSGGAR